MINARVHRITLTNVGVYANSAEKWTPSSPLLGKSSQQGSSKDCSGSSTIGRVIEGGANFLFHKKKEALKNH